MTQEQIKKLLGLCEERWDFDSRLNKAYCILETKSKSYKVTIQEEFDNSLDGGLAIQGAVTIPSFYVLGLYVDGVLASKVKVWKGEYNNSHSLLHNIFTEVKDGVDSKVDEIIKDIEGGYSGQVK